MSPHMIRLLAISGSLRTGSSNTALLQAAAHLAPPQVEIVLTNSLGRLPHFNPDLEADEPAEVRAFKDEIKGAAGLLFSSPEYAHGMPGVLKNALDWLVSGEEFVHKPVALVNASPRATHAQAALTEIVTVMSGRIVAEASITVSLAGRPLDPAGLAVDPEISIALRQALAAFARAIARSR